MIYLPTQSIGPARALPLFMSVFGSMTLLAAAVDNFVRPWVLFIIELATDLLIKGGMMTVRWFLGMSGKTISDVQYFTLIQPFAPHRKCLLRDGNLLLDVCNIFPLSQQLAYVFSNIQEPSTDVVNLLDDWLSFTPPAISPVPFPGSWFTSH